MIIKKLIMAFATVATLFCFVSCEKKEENSGSSLSEAAAASSEIKGDYYLDLTELGMKLTVYLRINEDNSFIFSNTTAFEVTKSAGTIEKGGSEYLMIFNSVNGEAKSASDGLQSKFVRSDNGMLDFTPSERVYYGAVGITPTSDEHPGAKLIACPVTADYKPREVKSVFRAGTYTAEAEGRTAYISFFDDESYLLTSYGNGMFFSETGKYGVSGMQMALTPQAGDRVSCEILSRDKMKLNVPVAGGERQDIDFTYTIDPGAPVSLLSEDGSASMKLYPDGSAEVSANGFTEKGVMALDSATGSFRFYPDHPETGKRGTGQVSNVPAGSLSVGDAGRITLSELRARTSEELGRTKMTFIQKQGEK